MTEDQDGPEKTIAHYERFDESARLSSVWGRLEFLRSRYIIERHLPPPPGVVLDVGGASGPYSCWLAEKGYEVHLMDPVPRHVQQAEEASQRRPRAPIASCRVGDARSLPFSDSTADAVLLLGPLYHLVEKEGRLRALGEARRVLKDGGLLFAAGISRFASAIDGLVQGFIRDPEFIKILEEDLRSGLHRNPTHNLDYFTDAQFHRPDELRSEIEEAGFTPEALLAVEGIAYGLSKLEEYWKRPADRDRVLQILERVEAEPSMLGASPHILCVARKPRPAGFF